MANGETIPCPDCGQSISSEGDIEHHDVPEMAVNDGQIHPVENRNRYL